MCLCTLFAFLLLLSVNDLFRAGGREPPSVLFLPCLEQHRFPVASPPAALCPTYTICSGSCCISFALRDVSSDEEYVTWVQGKGMEEGQNEAKLLKQDIFKVRMKLCPIKPGAQRKWDLQLECTPSGRPLRRTCKQCLTSWGNLSCGMPYRCGPGASYGLASASVRAKVWVWVYLWRFP